MNYPRSIIACMISMLVACAAFSGRTESLDQSLMDEVGALYKEKQYGTVIKKLERAWVEQRGKLPLQSAFWLSVSYFEVGEFGRAQPLLFRCAEQMPDDSGRFMALSRLAQVSLHNGEYKRATQQFAQAIDSAPSAAEFQKLIMLVADKQMQNGEFESAVHNLSQLVSAFPDNHTVRLRLLHGLYDSARYADCVHAAMQAAGVVPVQDRAETTYLLASSHRKLGQFAKAREIYGQLIQTFSASRVTANARYDLVLTEYDAGYFRDAAQRAESALQEHINPGESLRYLWLAARCHERLGQWQTAKEFYKRVLELSADPIVSAQALKQMMQIARKQGRSEEAAEYARILKEQFGGVIAKPYQRMTP